MQQSGADYGTRGVDVSMNSRIDITRNESELISDNMRMDSIDISRDLEFTQKFVMPESNQRYQTRGSVDSMVSNNLYEQYKR